CPHCVKKEIEALGPKVRYIPPHCPNANADVESSHRLIEDEFYSKHIFFSKNDFLNKTNTFLLFFNFLRKNSYKDYKTPFNILNDYNYFNEDIAYIRPIIVDDLFKNYNPTFSFMDNYLFHYVTELPDFLKIINYQAFLNIYKIIQYIFHQHQVIKLF
ncbi:MAG TPA: integrase core domain-containing protein, partial [bacterium]|nr:integrase core domain-containing protein [bacterium]